MFYSLNGIIADKAPGFVNLVVNGVGYRVALTATLWSKLTVGQKIKLYISTHLREDKEDFYGFVDVAKLHFFELLTKVNGIGPKAALGILSLGDVTAIKQAISTANIAFITRVPGIGKKTAERLVVELKSKIEAGEVVDVAAMLSEPDKEALEALKALGYSVDESQKMLAGSDPAASLEEKVRHALQIKKS